MEPMLALGVDVKTGRPVDVPLAVLTRHAWLMAMTGGSKSLIATQLAIKVRKLVPDACLVVADFGGDQYMFHRVRDDTLAAQKRFRFLSTNPADDWDTFEPLQAVTPLSEAGVVKATSLVVSSLSLDYGEGFGKGFFGKVNYSICLRPFAAFWAAGILDPTFRQYAENIARAARRTRMQDISEAQLAAEQLLSYSQLVDGPDSDRRIDAARAIEAGETVYGFLPTLLEPPARTIGSLLVWSFVLAAVRRTYAGLPRKQVYIIIDEFAAVAAAKAFSDLLTLARKYGISLILLNQTSSQLVSRERDLRTVVFDNTALKIWFTPLGDDIDILKGLSRDVTKLRGKTTSSRVFTGSVSLGEVYEAELERNDVLDTAFTGLEAFVVANEFRGHKEPQRVRFVPDVSRDEHAALSIRPLPKRPDPTPRPQFRSAQVGLDSGRAARRAAIDAVLAAKRREEDWQSP